MKFLNQLYGYIAKKTRIIKTETRFIILDLISSEGSLPYRLDAILSSLYDIEEIVM